MFRFANPEYLFLLALLPLVAIYYWRRRAQMSGKIKYSSLRHLKKLPGTLRQVLLRQLYLLRLLILGLLILGLARPQSGARQEEVTTEGIDIMLVLDVSSSMLA